MYGPSFFEALLATKVAGFEVHLFACRTHHRCFFATSGRPAQEIGILHSWYIIKNIHK